MYSSTIPSGRGVLTVLKTLLTAAVDWDVLDQMPCVVRLLEVPRTCASFHDFAAYERLVDGPGPLAPMLTSWCYLGARRGCAVAR